MILSLDALLHHLISASPPALLLTYPSHAISSTLLSSRTFVTHLLFLFTGQDPPSTAFLTSVSHAVLANPTGLEASDHLSSTLAKPSVSLASIPDVGTSASAIPEPVPTVISSTLALLLPLLRLCSTTAGSHVPQPIIDLTTLLLSLLEPFPAPSLDVGLEAGNLLQSLPEALAAPLRHCLSGLMADLAISQDTARLRISSTSADPLTTASTRTGPPVSLTSDVASLPLPQALSFLLAHLHRSARWTRQTDHASDHAANPLRPPENHIQLIRLGPHIAHDPSTFLLHLFLTAVNDWGGSYNGGSSEGVSSWLFLTEALPLLLRWWKDHPDPKWPFPVCHGFHMYLSLDNVYSRHLWRPWLQRSKCKLSAWRETMPGYQQRTICLSPMQTTTMSQVALLTRTHGKSAARC